MPTDDLESRVTNLEHAVVRLREQAALTATDADSARVLAAGADHDVSEVRAELRAHTQALNALRETQLEQGQAIRELSREMHEQGREMRDGFATLSTGMSQITTLLQNVIDTDQGS